MSYKNKSYSDYQKDYREKNKQKAKEYQKDYREKVKHNLLFPKPDIEPKKQGKSRIYVCKLDDNRIKIGATFKNSNRIYNLTRISCSLGLDLIPLMYFDCENDILIKKIEKHLKEKYCENYLGINIHSFKNEVANINKLQSIKTDVEYILEKSNYSYQITILK